MTKRLIKTTFLFMLLTLFVACGPVANHPTPTPIFGPISAKPGRAAELAPTVVSSGAGMPGRLLFVKNGDLWLWQGDTGQQLTNQGDLFQPTWSPNGTRIACVQRGASYSDIIIMAANGTEPLRLTNDGQNAPSNSFERIYHTLWAFYPAFSPDGTQVAFVSQAGPPVGEPAAEYNLSLYVTSAAAGGSKQQLYAAESGQVGRATYAPDGDLVFTNFSTGQAAPQLLSYSQDSGAVAPLPGAPDQSYDPAFSHDGHWLAFAVRMNGRTDIFAMPGKGGAPVQLTNLGTARAPAFSPDGTKLAFLALAPQATRFDLWVVNLTPEADGLRVDQPHQITHNAGIDVDSGLAWSR